MNIFENKVAAITGAGSGIGRGLALELAKRGCHLSLSDINEQGLEETAKQISGVKVTTQSLDVANRDAVHAWAAQSEQDHGAVNMVFNNAGVSVTDSAEHMSQENMNWLMDINFWGVVHGCQAFLPLLKNQASDQNLAQIINTSSIFGTIAVPTQSLYNASKFAVRGYSYALRQELAEENIGVSCVQPGGVKTNIVNNSRYVPASNEAATLDEMGKRFEQIARTTPAGAANQILKGIMKNKAQILVGGDAKFMALLERLFPIAYQKILPRLIPDD